jgi:Asp-tRNA(Asn)/Glu-tRNA(Gln) amidotransferase B subunit
MIILLQSATPPPGGIVQQYAEALDATSDFLSTTNNLAAALVGVVLIVLAMSAVAALYLIRIGGARQREVTASGELIKIVAKSLADSQEQIRHNEKLLAAIVEQFEKSDKRHLEQNAEADKRYIESLTGLSSALNYMGDLYQAQKQDISVSKVSLARIESGVDQIATVGSKPLQDLAREVGNLIQLVQNIQSGQISAAEKLEILPEIAENISMVHLAVRSLTRQAQQLCEIKNGDD